MGHSRIAGAVALIAVAVVAFSSDAPAGDGSAPGSLVFVRESDPPGQRSTLQRLDLKTEKVRELFAPGRQMFDIAVSPDGDEIAYVTLGRPGDQIRIVGSDGTGDRGLVSGDLIIDDINWTPDGAGIVYTAGPFDRRGSRQLRRSEVYSVAVEGGEPTRLTRDDRADFDASVTPDGKRIVFSRNAELQGQGAAPKLDLHSMAIDGTDLQRITNTKADEYSAEVSPDGRRIVYIRNLTPVLPEKSEQRRRFMVQVSDIDGGNRVTVERGAGNEYSPTWSPDGKRIAFASDRADRKAADDYYYRHQLYTAKPDGSGVERLVTSRFGDDLPRYVP